MAKIKFKGTNIKVKTLSERDREHKMVKRILYVLLIISSLNVADIIHKHKDKIIEEAKSIYVNLQK